MVLSGLSHFVVSDHVVNQSLASLQVKQRSRLVISKLRPQLRNSEQDDWALASPQHDALRTCPVLHEVHPQEEDEVDEEPLELEDGDVEA